MRGVTMIDMVLAIRPRHWRAIRDGRKTLELRRTRPARRPRFIWLYVTVPYRRVMGVVRCVQMREIVNPAGLAGEGEWNRRFLRDACIDGAAAAHYLAGASKPTAIQIGGYEREIRPLADFGLTRPPQSWAWSTSREWIDAAAGKEFTDWGWTEWRRSNH